MAYKVCVYAICRNEEKFVKRWMHSMREADSVVVLDTGSTDQTVALLRKEGAVVYQEKVGPWRFDVARNRSLEHVPQDVDICVCTDLDEVLNSGWRQNLEKAWTPKATKARYLYDWQVGTKERPNIRYVYEKIHARKGYQWVHPVHEVLAYSGEKEEAVWAEGVHLRHYPDAKKSRGQYLPLLELSTKENPKDSQTSFWLGREYFFHGQLEKAIVELNRYLRLPTSTWAEERSAAMRYVARCFWQKRDKTRCLSWLYRALAQSPNLRESYWELAQTGYFMENWPLVYWAATAGLACKVPSGSYLKMPEAWGSSLYDLRSLACSALGMFKQAEKDIREALVFTPHDERLKNNLLYVRSQEEKG